MNIDLLLKVKEQILKQPELFDMSRWFLPTECGTAACIAGWAWLLSGREEREFSGDRTRMVPQLDLTAEQERSLFHVCDWPRIFAGHYKSARTPAYRARIGAERIDHFIATNGDE